MYSAEAAAEDPRLTDAEPAPLSRDDADATSVEVAAPGEVTARPHDRDSVMLERARVRVLPGVFYTPETSGGAGLMNSVTFWGDDDWAPTTVRSFFRLSAVYTLRRQTTVQLSFRFRRPGWVLAVLADYEVRSFPDRIYGVGDETSEEYLLYTQLGGRMRNRLRFRPWPDIYLSVGLARVLQISWDLRDGNVPVADANVALRDPPGFDGFGHRSPFVWVEWDRRDHPLVATRGTYLSLRLEPSFGHGYQRSHWLRTALDGRAYASLGARNNHVIAGRVHAEFNTSQVPFVWMATLGGSQRIRGMYNGRRRDQHSLFTEVEYRSPFIWRVAGTVFVGAGSTFGNGRLLRDVVVNAGVGLRLRLDEDARLHARVDVSHGNYDGPGLVGALGEAF